MSTQRMGSTAHLSALVLAAGLLAGGPYGPTAQAGPAIKLSGWVWGMKPGDTVSLLIQGPVKRQINARPGGAWVADGLPAGEYKIVPRSPGYSFQPPARTAKPGTGGLNAINFRATPPAAATSSNSGAGRNGFAIRGRVRGLPGGERVLVRAQGPSRAEVMTRPGGQYTLADLAPGTYRVEVVDERWRTKPAGRNVKVKRRDRTHIHFTAKRRPGAVADRPKLESRPKPVSRHTVKGRVDGLKALLHGCTSAVVVAEGGGESLRAKTMVSEDVRVCGRFIFRDVPAGVYRLTVHVTGNAFTRYEVSPASRKVNVRDDVQGLTFEVDEKERRSHRRRRRSR